MKLIHCADLHLDSPLSAHLTREQAKERRQELLGAIDALENTDREILLRKYFMSQNSKDIARIMHMTVSAVDTRAHRALKKLRSILGGDKYE